MESDEVAAQDNEMLFQGFLINVSDLSSGFKKANEGSIQPLLNFEKRRK